MYSSAEGGETAVAGAIIEAPGTVAHLGIHRHCTVAHLAEVFAQSQEQIVDEWRLQVGDLLRERHLDKPTLTNHMPDLIAEITRDLELNRDGSIAAEQTRGSPPVHGVQRFHDGLDVGEVVGEYNLLRAAFLTIAERNNLYLVGEAARIINRRIDEAVRLSVTAFAAQQALMRKEQEDEHLAFVAHDLRTPLNAVSLLVDQLKSGLDQKTVTATGNLFEILQRNLQRVSDLITKVLEMKLPASALGTSFQPQCRTFELWPLVQRLIVDLHSVASKHDITVVNEIPHSLTMFADAGLISQVFQNLLGNSFKYAARGRVVVSASEAGDSVNCVVQDNGTGIPLEMLSKVFDKLATDPEREGTGVGLTIVKQIVEAHGGSVSADNAQGSGATLRFSIPKPRN